MNYDDALNYVQNTLKFGIKLGLHNMTSLLDLMGNPHQRLKFVHVAGTNGKGSTVAFISSILAQAGCKTGIYTSPAIERFTERIRINKNEISEDELARLTTYVKTKIDIMTSTGGTHPTEFEIVTAIAFQYFFEKNCDIVVLEVGLGGRFDSTNVIPTPIVSILTTINFDHMDKLGNTLQKIAFEKAGIIKSGGDIVVYPQKEEVIDVFAKAIKENNAVMHLVDFSTVKLIKAHSEGQIFDFEEYKNIEIKLLGHHQIMNAVVAISAIRILQRKGYYIDKTYIYEGLLNTVWHGRIEVLCKAPMFIIDGAHNAEGAQALAKTLSDYFPEKKKIFIVGVFKDKDYQSMIKAVLPIAAMFIVITPESERALPAGDLAIFIKSYCKDVCVSDTIEEAVRTSLKLCQTDCLICSFGSLSYLGEVRKMFFKRGC